MDSLTTEQREALWQQAQLFIDKCNRIDNVKMAYLKMHSQKCILFIRICRLPWNPYGHLASSL